MSGNLSGDGGWGVLGDGPIWSGRLGVVRFVNLWLGLVGSVKVWLGCRDWSGGRGMVVANFCSRFGVRVSGLAGRGVWLGLHSGVWGGRPPSLLRRQPPCVQTFAKVAGGLRSPLSVTPASISVIPAQAGIQAISWLQVVRSAPTASRSDVRGPLGVRNANQRRRFAWIPACAGMTESAGTTESG